MKYKIRTINSDSNSGTILDLSDKEILQFPTRINVVNIKYDIENTLILVTVDNDFSTHGKWIFSASKPKL